MKSLYNFISFHLLKWRSGNVVIKLHELQIPEHEEMFFIAFHTQVVLKFEMKASTYKRGLKKVNSKILLFEGFSKPDDFKSLLCFSLHIQLFLQKRKN